MSDALRQSVSPELIADWRLRVSKLDSVIAREPAGEWTWLWRTRRDILTYLLGRYSPEPAIVPVDAPGPPEPPQPLALPAASPARPPPATLSSESLDPYVRSADEKTGPTVTSGKDMSGILRRLAAENQQRQATVDAQRVAWERARAIREWAFRQQFLAEQEEVRARRGLHAQQRRSEPQREPDPLQRARNTSYPDEGFALPNESVRLEERRVMQAEADAIGTLIDDVAKLHYGKSLPDEVAAAILRGVEK